MLNFAIDFDSNQEDVNQDANHTLVEWGLLNICKDEDCPNLSLHAFHKTKAIKQVKTKERHDKSRMPWERASPKALAHAIANATSRTYPTHFKQLLTNVKNDYGQCCDRMVYRILKKMVAKGHIVKLDLGKSMFAYIRPSRKGRVSSLINDAGLVREQIESCFDSSRLDRIPHFTRAMDAVDQSEGVSF